MDVIWNEMADSELKEAYKWYESKEIGLGNRLVTCIDASINIILRHPFIGPPVADDVRRILIKRFPYGVYYKVAKDNIIVIGFRHFKQRTRLFKQR